MNRQEAEHMAKRILQKAPHLDVQSVHCYARIVENEHQWQNTQAAWNIADKIMRKR